MTRPEHGGNLAWAAALAGCPASAILDFSASISPLGPPESVVRAIQDHFHQLRVYPDPDYRELRQVLGQIHNLDPAWILPGNGSAELLTWAAWDLSKLEATYLVTPAFGDYWRALKTFEANSLASPLGLNKPHSLSFPNNTTSAGLLLNNPHNPTGRLFQRAEILPLLQQFALVVIDEAFMDFLPPTEQQSLTESVADFPNLVILRSLTKFYSLPGLRLGYALAHPDRLQRWQRQRDPWPVNTLAAVAGIAAVQDTAFQEHSWSWLRMARQQLLTDLATLPGLSPYPGAANFLLVKSDYSVSRLQQLLLKQHRILIRDCLSFPELGDSYFRVAVRTEADQARLLTGLAEVLSQDISSENS